MSGHNKWSKIKRKKGASDAKRSKIFSKIVKEVHVAVKENGADPATNPRLRMAISNAKGVNMPKDNIDRTIKKAKEAGGESYAEIIYEGMGPGGVAFIVECLTDNLQRTVASIRHAFTKGGGHLGTQGAVDYMFDRKGIFSVAQGEHDEEEFILDLIDGGAEDVDLHDGYFSITTTKRNFGNMQKYLEQANIHPESAALEYVPKATKAADIETAKKVMKLVDMFEDDEDVQAVHYNLEITEELVTEMG